MARKTPPIPPPARVAGQLGEQNLKLVLDTGAAATMICPAVRTALGYSAREADGLSSVSSIVGREIGYRIRVREFQALGYAFPNFSVAAHHFPDGFGIDFSSRNRGNRRKPASRLGLSFCST